MTVDVVVRLAKEVEIFGLYKTETCITIRRTIVICIVGTLALQVFEGKMASSVEPIARYIEVEHTPTHAEIVRNELARNLHVAVSAHQFHVIDVGVECLHCQLEVHKAVPSYYFQLYSIVVQVVHYKVSRLSDVNFFGSLTRFVVDFQCISTRCVRTFPLCSSHIVVFCKVNGTTWFGSKHVQVVTYNSFSDKAKPTTCSIAYR